MPTSTAQAGLPARFKVSKKEMTFIITGIEIGMGLIEALLLVNIINYFQKLPLRLPTFMEIAKITLVLTFTGFIGGALSANIIEQIEKPEVASPEAETEAEAGTETASTSNFSNFSNVYDIARVPVSWMIPSVKQLPKHLQPQN